MMNLMRTKALLSASLLAVSFCVACKKQLSDNDAIRAGILHHLQVVGTLNISAMDMDLRIVSINGNKAHAEVEFRPKTGGPPGAGMVVAYNLERRDDGWVVLQTQPAGGTINHPAGQNPNQNPNVHSDAFGGTPNFSEIVNPGAAPATLPPGHPPINSQSSGQPQSPPQKPQ